MGSVEKRCRCRTAEQKTACRCPPSVVSWRAAYYYRGRRVRETFPRKGLADAWVVQQEASIHRGDHVDPADGRMLFSEWVAEWSPPREAVLKRSTWLAEKGRLGKHLVPYFGDMMLMQITPSEVRKWVGQLKLAPKTIQHCHAILSHMLADAIEEGILLKNPCRNTPLPEVVRREMAVLTTPQLSQLYGQIRLRYRPLVVLLALTGMRFGEAVGLKVGRVDLLEGVIRIEETLNQAHGKITTSTPKTRTSRRRIRISPRVVDELLPLVAGKESDEYVFTSHWGRPVRERMFRDQVWYPAIDALGWSPRPRPHDLRHTHAAHLIAAGVPLTAIQRRLGHASISVTSDTYGHLLPGVEDALVASIDTGYETLGEAGGPTTSPQTSGDMPGPQVKRTK